MLTDLCQELRNWFDLERYKGTYTISGGTLTADFLQTNQYYRIKGSVFNDGVHRNITGDILIDETFKGEVWALGIPQAVVELSDKIDAWVEKYGNVDSQSMSPFQSESFGGYSYSKGNSSAAAGASASTPTGWKAVFASELNRWRKI